MEQVLSSFQSHFFKLNPSLCTSKGWAAESFDPQTMLVFSGDCKLVKSGQFLKINLLTEEGDTFTTIPIQKAEDLESCFDSSRYFVLTLSEDDRTAFIGIGFDTREQSFDFNTLVNSHFHMKAQINKVEKGESLIQTTDFGALDTEFDLDVQLKNDNSRWATKQEKRRIAPTGHSNWVSFD